MRRFSVLALLSTGMLLLTTFAAAQQTVSETVIANVAVGQSPIAVAVDIRANRIYATGNIANQMWVIDGQSNIMTATVGLPGRPGVPSANPITGKVYVPVLINGSPSGVAVVDESTNQVTSVIETGGLPVVSAVNPVTNRIYVTNSARFRGPYS